MIMTRKIRKGFKVINVEDGQGVHAEVVTVHLVGPQPRMRCCHACLCDYVVAVDIAGKFVLDPRSCLLLLSGSSSEN